MFMLKKTHERLVEELTTKYEAKLIRECVDNSTRLNSKDKEIEKLKEVVKALEKENSILKNMVQEDSVFEKLKDQCAAKLAQLEDMVKLKENRAKVLRSINELKSFVTKH